MLPRNLPTRLVLATFALAIGTTAALARTDARQLTCPQLQSLLARQNETILTTGPHTYDTYVSGPTACGPDYLTAGDRVRTKDGKMCVIYRCVYQGSDSGSMFEIRPR